MWQRRNYQRIIALITYVDRRIQTQETVITDFKRGALALVEVDDPAWLDWKPTRLDMEVNLYRLKRVRSELLYQKHSARG